MREQGSAHQRPPAPFPALLAKTREMNQPNTAKPQPDTLVLGLGNPLLRDDGVGLKVVRALQDRLQDRGDLEFGEDYWGGLRLMERMIGFKRAIIVDAIQTGAPPGTLHMLRPGDLSTQRSASAHDVNLTTALQVGRQAGAFLPQDEDILLVGIEAEDVQTFSEELSPSLQAALPAAIRTVLTAIEERRKNP